MWAFSLSTESYLQKKLATSLALRHVQHRQPTGTPAAMHDLIRDTFSNGHAALQLRQRLDSSAPAKRFISQPIRNTPDQDATSPATIKQTLTVHSGCLINPAPLTVRNP
ncbi:hypothetical protein [Pseudomonas sp. EA_35y_Pfl2_R111]|uniref:hypothetical protein n=1 Tax=Pseudomonas sp. EA_35y_Pfl2_R111 TaxID=3088689 RepID=UPI0030DA6D8A